MNRDKSNIYWRDEEASFLPVLDENEIKRTFEAILIELHKKSEITFFEAYKVSEEYQSKLSSQYGCWFPQNLLNSLIHKKYYRSGMTGDTKFKVKADDFDSIASDCLKDIVKYRNDIDDLLGRVHSKYINFSDTLDSTEECSKRIKSIAEAIALEVAEVEDTYDAWYYSVGEKTSYFFDVLGIEIDPDELENLAEKHFESWVWPTEVSLQGFSDEIAAISAKKLFEKKYMKND